MLWLVAGLMGHVLDCLINLPVTCQFPALHLSTIRTNDAIGYAICQNILTRVLIIVVISQTNYLAFKLGHNQSIDAFLRLFGVMTPWHGVYGYNMG